MFIIFAALVSGIAYALHRYLPEDVREVLGFFPKG